jgi:hypothetical protein
MSAAVEGEDEDAWKIPLNGVSLEGGSNFGSGVYDALVDGVVIDVVICDKCIQRARDNGRVRERRTHCDEFFRNTHN